LFSGLNIRPKQVHCRIAGNGNREAAWLARTKIRYNGKAGILELTKEARKNNCRIYALT